MPDQPLAPGELPAPGVEGIVVSPGGGLEGVERPPGCPPIDRHEPPGDLDVANQLRIEVAPAAAAPEQLRPVALGPVGPDEVLLRSRLRLEHPQDHEQIYPSAPRAASIPSPAKHSSTAPRTSCQEPTTRDAGGSPSRICRPYRLVTMRRSRSEERRVGKECRYAR